VLAAGVLQLSVPAVASASVAVRGKATTADLSYAPTQINFGRVSPLSVTTWPIKITNISSHNLTFTGAQTATASVAFSFYFISAPNCATLSGGTLAPGATCYLDAGFSPPVRGLWKAEGLSYWSSDGFTTSDVTGTVLLGSS
jgi:hypothetical protein